MTNQMLNRLQKLKLDWRRVHYQAKVMRLFNVSRKSRNIFLYESEEVK